MNKYGVQIDIEVLDLLDTTSRQKEVFFLSSLFHSFNSDNDLLGVLKLLLLLLKNLFF